jgi:hypothetical protein
MQSATFQTYVHHRQAEAKQHRQAPREPGAGMLHWNPEVLQRDMTDMAAYHYQLQASATQMLHSASGAASSLLNDLVAYWKLDEASGIRSDSHGTNHLTDNNTVGSTAGKLGNAAAFVAANSEYLSCDTASLNPGTSDFTIAVWFRTTSTTYKSIAGVYSGSSAAGCVLAADNGQVYSFFRDASGHGGFSSVTGTGYNDGNWHLYVAEFDRDGYFTPYIDNVALTGTSIATVGDVSPAGIFAIGARSSSNHWDGDLDEVAIWKRLLSPEERTHLWNSGAGLTYPFA